MIKWLLTRGTDVSDYCLQFINKDNHRAINQRSAVVLVHFLSDKMHSTPSICLMLDSNPLSGAFQERFTLSFGPSRHNVHLQWKELHHILKTYPQKAAGEHRIPVRRCTVIKMRENQVASALTNPAMDNVAFQGKKQDVWLPIKGLFDRYTQSCV